MRRIKKLLSLPGEERRLLLRSAILLSQTSLTVRAMPFARWRHRLQPPAARRQTACYAASQIVWAVGVAARYVPGANCLVQALVAKQLFDEQGLPAEIRLGVHKPEEVGFRAHAWLESEGRIVLGGAESASLYAPFPAR